MMLQSPILNLFEVLVWAFVLASSERFVTGIPDPLESKK